MSSLRTLAFLALIAGISGGQTSDCSHWGLLNHLKLTTRNDVLAMMRPVKNWTHATPVQMDMLLYGILEVDEKFQTVTSHVWIQMRWKNEFLTWNSSDFCGIDMLTVPRSMLWIPDVTIQEDASDSGSIQDSPHISLYPSGLVLANRRQRLTSTCQLRLYLFPFDVQHCNITFLSMNYDALILGTYYSGKILTSVSELTMVTEGEWQLKNIEITHYTITKVGTSHSRLVYMVKIMRKPMLYVINLIVPLFCLLVLDLATFFISDARGEKLSFKVTLLLSISVLLLILQDMLPSTEDSLPMIACYCIVVFTLVWISLLEAILVSFLMELDGYCFKEAQSAANAEVEIQLEANGHKEPAGAEESGRVRPAKGHLARDGPGDHDLLKLILEEVRAARQEAGGQHRDERKPGRYRRLAEIVDSAFFVLYFLTVVIFVVCMFKAGFQNYTANDNH
ncbi:5-hydroxytryptamine receptor 3A-like [Xiphias gladius]|uniref:5-hydroxytryptamine receptor 3A-like n=1 Tax=Xiphias gladius TaxID=8245 RepID=UPI001A98FF2F|nr:5-hydroxytryptamine receptor 3A-like [Xiphias gladius]